MHVAALRRFPAFTFAKKIVTAAHRDSILIGLRGFGESVEFRNSSLNP